MALASSNSGSAVGAALLSHDVAAEDADRKEEDGQDDAAARELILIHAGLRWSAEEVGVVKVWPRTHGHKRSLPCISGILR